jgi:hypothetical protein
MTVMSVIAACLLGAGVLRHYWDIYLYRSVRGISFIFVAIDAAGDLFSLLSLGLSPFTSFIVVFKLIPLPVFDQVFDGLGAAIYATELVLWIGIMICGVVFNLRHWYKSKTDFKDDKLEKCIRLSIRALLIL